MFVVALTFVLAAADVPRIVVLDAKPATAADADVARSIGPFLVAAIAKANPRAQVVSPRELKDVAGLAANQQLLGCADDRCVAQQAALQNALAADTVVSSEVARIDGHLTLSLSLIRAKDARVVARATGAIDKHATSAIVDVANRATGALPATTDGKDSPFLVLAQTLAAPAASAAGDQALADLRVAVLVDEYDGEKVARVRSVENCLFDALQSAGATVKEGSLVAGLHDKAPPKNLIEGGDVLSSIGTNDVDVILAGVVEYAPGTDASSLLGAAAPATARGTGVFRMVRLDSGAVLAAREVEGVGNGNSADKARREAARKVCDAAGPALRQAMGQASARPLAVDVQVDGIKSADAVKDLVAKLGKTARVLRVANKKVTDKQAILLVTTDGLDGVALALELAGTAGATWTITSAEATRVVARLP